LLTRELAVEGAFAAEEKKSAGRAVNDLRTLGEDIVHVGLRVDDGTRGLDAAVFCNPGVVETEVVDIAAGNVKRPLSCERDGGDGIGGGEVAEPKEVGVGRVNMEESDPGEELPGLLDEEKAVTHYDLGIGKQDNGQGAEDNPA
jgi:hypothetical protein